MAQQTPTTTQQYINNPFMVAAEGIKLFFTRAMGIAIILLIISAISTVNFSSPTAPSSPAPASPASGHVSVDATNAPVVIGITLLIILAGIAILVLGTILNGITSFGAARVSQGKDASLKEAWRATTERFWSLIWLQVLLGLKLVAWSLLFIIPGIVMYFRYSLATIAFFDKDLRGNAAIKESLALTKGSWLTTFSSQVLFSVVSLGTLSKLVPAAATAVLYRQFQATPLAERPKAHGLSIATLVIAILIFIGGIVAAAIASFIESSMATGAL